MRLRTNRLTSILGVTALAGGTVVVATTWDFKGDATAQEAPLTANVSEATAASPLMSEQPLAVTVPADDADVEDARNVVYTNPQPQTPYAAIPPAETETVTVMVDHAKVVRLPDRTQTVIVGNPMIADITVQRNGILVVTGKAYGATNLIALDSGGVLLAESVISVQAPTDAVVTVQRGLARESYSCTPTCQPSLRLGDAQEHFGNVGNQATQRNTLATQR
jgi:Flp pilus assembly secretin CpaC